MEGRKSLTSDDIVLKSYSLKITFIYAILAVLPDPFVECLCICCWLRGNDIVLKGYHVTTDVRVDVVP